MAGLIFSNQVVIGIWRAEDGLEWQTVFGQAGTCLFPIQAQANCQWENTRL